MEAVSERFHVSLIHDELPMKKIGTYFLFEFNSKDSIVGKRTVFCCSKKVLGKLFVEKGNVWWLPSRVQWWRHIGLRLSSSLTQTALFISLSRRTCCRQWVSSSSDQILAHRPNANGSFIGSGGRITNNENECHTIIKEEPT